jgi:hypothetical protein
VPASNYDVREMFAGAALPADLTGHSGCSSSVAPWVPATTT